MPSILDQIEAFAVRHHADAEPRQFYYYSGNAGAERRIPIGGSVVADLDATVVADFPAALWVPSTDFAGGGTLALGMVVPFGRPDVGVSAVISGPQGGAAAGSRQDDAFVVGDPVLTGMLGWSKGDYHWQVSTMVNLPIGHYRKDQLANLAFNRWAVDTSVALTWHDAERGWDISGKTGLTFNGENDHTDYDTGTEWHTEVSIERTFSESFSAGAQLYRFQQISDDTGAGANLGAFRGEVTGVGVTANWNMQIAERPATLRLRAFKEFDVKNRMEGESVFLDFSIPLVMRLPGG